MKNTTFRLGSKLIDRNSGPYIIAEIGVNHEGSIEKAKEMIDLAKLGGADAVKFQSYKAERLASKNSPSYWDLKEESTTSQFKLFKKYDSFEESDYLILAEYSRNKEIDFISTPFDNLAIEFLDPIVPFFKISSSDITNLPFLKKIGSKNKIVILSTGASNIEEIDLALKTLQKAGSQEIFLLHCILNYPTKIKDANLDMITSMKEFYPDNIIGYSDHTVPDEGMFTLITAYMLGAMIIEKHFTFDKNLPGNDHYHSMDVNDLKNLKKNIRKIISLRGNSDKKKSLKSEGIARDNARRSIVISKNLSKDHIITQYDLTYKRPGTGISPIYWDKIIGKKVIRDLEEDHILKWEDLK